MQRAVDHPGHPPLKILHHLARAYPSPCSHGRRLSPTFPFPLRSHPAPLWLATATGPNNNVPLLDPHSQYRALKYASHEDRRAARGPRESPLHAPLSQARVPTYPTSTSELYRREEMSFSLLPSLPSSPSSEISTPTENIYLAGRTKCPRILSCNSALHFIPMWQRLLEMAFNFVILVCNKIHSSINLSVQLQRHFLLLKRNFTKRCHHV